MACSAAAMASLTLSASACSASLARLAPSADAALFLDHAGLLVQPGELGDREEGDPADRVSPVGQPPEKPQALDVEVGVEALSSLGPCGTHHSVAPLPRPEDVGREPGSDGDQADGVSGDLGLDGLCHRMTIGLCLDNVKQILSQKLDRRMPTRYFLRQSLDKTTLTRG